jgi:REP element-mobilizing transposase RayT
MERIAVTRLERLSHAAQIVSAIAVVVSILYLAEQIRSNTRAVNYEAARGLKELQFQIDAWDRDSSHVAMMMKGDADPAKLTAVEWYQYARRWANRHSVWSMAYSGFADGTLQRAEWEGWDRSYSGTVCLPGRIRFWNERREWYSREFQAHVDSVVVRC